MAYDIETSKRESADLKKVFGEMFPLANERDLPWALCHIPEFLKTRIRLEVEQGTFHFTSSVVKVLCEISPPKTHVVDMARIVVEEVKGRRGDVQRLERELRDLKQATDAAIHLLSREQIPGDECTRVVELLRRCRGKGE